MKRIGVLEPGDGDLKPQPDPTREQLLSLVTACLRQKGVKGQERERLLELKIAMESEELAEGVTEFFDAFFAEPGTIQLIGAALGKYIKKAGRHKRKSNNRR